MFTLNCKGRLVKVHRPIVMGIINITPDSFYAGSRKPDTLSALKQAEKMVWEGATILDIGAQSTRPGSVAVGPEEETRRLNEVLPELSRHFPETVLSVDTYYSQVARSAVNMGVSMINDISGGQFDTQMLSVVSSLHVPYVCMHVKGTVDTMHQQPIEQPVTSEVMNYFTQRIHDCIQSGIADLILDPGFGFSKTLEQNFELIRHTSVLKTLGKPILIGVSRKSTIYKTLHISPEDALNGTTVLHTAALLGGADILRVHDVKEAMEAIELTRHLIS